MDAIASLDRQLSQHRRHLVRVAHQRLCDEDDAEDMVQDTLLAALEGQAVPDVRDNVQTWLTGILLDRIDHRSRAAPPRPGTETWTSDGSRARQDPARLLESRQLVAQLHAGLQALPRQAARAFTLREIEGLDTGDASRELNVSLGQCAVLLHRARTRLRRRLEHLR